MVFYKYAYMLVYVHQRFCMDIHVIHTYMHIKISVLFTYTYIHTYTLQLTASGAITIGDLSAFLLYTAYVTLSINGVASFWTELMKVWC